MAPCFSPSARLMAACRAPSDSVISAVLIAAADFSRSMAAFTPGGGSISLISTWLTLMPQRPVTSSILTWSWSRILSRSESASESEVEPITALSVAKDRLMVATR